MNEQLLTPVSYLRELIDAESRAVVKRHNAAGYIAMWPEAIRKVMVKFPNLSADERTVLRGTVNSQIQMFCARRNMDVYQFTGAMGSVARILGGATC